MSKKEFSADVAQLINLVTNSIYSNKDIFLRELLSNASDALAKAQFNARTDTKYLGDDHTLQITVDVDEENKMITINDNGIGMTEQQVVDHIGTIAKSGTKAFVEKINTAEKETSSADLIGQFGIGFYSVFMVAQKVELETKSNDEEKATLRISEGTGSYELSKSKKTSRGTTIRIYLKEENNEYASAFKVKSLIHKHSNYVPFPVMMLAEKKEDETEENKTEYTQVNKTQSLWSKRKNEVTDEEYQEFYSSLSFDQAKPLDILHIHVEGAINYKALLYIPQMDNPMAAMMGNQDEFGPALYVNNILIMDNAKELLPTWLRFIKGVVETPDLPLNVSREILQNNAIMNKIQKSLVKKVLESLRYQLKENTDHYKQFFTNYGTILKEGIHFSFDQKEAIAGLTLRESYQGNKKVTLDDYIPQEDDSKKTEAEATDEEKEEKSKVYYLTGINIDQLRSSPYLEKFKDASEDVLLMVDPIDDWVTQALHEYKGHKLQDAKHAQLTSNKDAKKVSAEKKEQDKINQDNKDFLAFSKETIGKERIDSIELVTTLTDSVAVLLPKEGAASPQQERYMKAMGQPVPMSVQDLQINANHPIIQTIIKKYAADKDNIVLQDYITYIYESALLLQGRDVSNMTKFIKTTNTLISN